MKRFSHSVNFFFSSIIVSDDPNCLILLTKFAGRRTIAKPAAAWQGLFGPAFAGHPAWAAINANKLGAIYEATKANVTFKVYSSRATRIELDLYSNATGTAELRSSNATQQK